ncbi:MAG: hypothetical protein Q7R87_01525 [Nanoarchaeota archaeon]|nr:hypothetical protein [Nanoarchaeota archaeon]
MKNIYRGNKEAEMIEKVIRVYDSIIKYANKLGISIPYSEFEKLVINSFKESKKKISKKEINELFSKLTSAEIVFIKKGFIERVINSGVLNEKN